MGKLSREKGKAGEREVVSLLRAYGFEARRGQQFRGGPDSPDIIHSIPNLYIEVKRREQVNLYQALDTADREKPPTDRSIIFHRKNSKRWLITMNAHDFLIRLQHGRQ